MRIVISGLLSCAGTVFRFHCLFLCFITAERNSERVVGSNYFICLQTNVMIYSCGCNVFTADRVSERVTSLNILSAYRPIQCGGIVIRLPLSRLDSYYLSTDHCNVEKNVLWLRLWAGFPLSVYELMLMWRNLLSRYVSHWVSTIQL